MINYKRYILLFLLINFYYSVSFSSNPDSTFIIKSWKLNSFYDEIKEISVDTSLNDFQIYNPIFQNSISNAFLGNLSSPSFSNILQSNNFYNSNFENYYLKSIEPFLFSYQNNFFYNTKKPFTNIYYTNGGQEQSLSVFHTRNVNKNLNFGLKYNLVSSQGYYKRQKAKKNSITLFSSYISTYYNLHTALSSNKFLFYENGGLANINTTNSTDYISPEYFSVNLEEANSIIKYTSAFLNQELKLGNTKLIIDSTQTDTNKIQVKNFTHFASLFHTLEFYRSYRIYEDANPLSGFYNGVETDSIDTQNDSTIVNYIDFNLVPIYMDSTTTYDSIAQQLFSNSVQFKLNDKRFKVGARFSFSHEIMKHSLPNLDSILLFDTISLPYKNKFDTIYSNTSISAGLYNTSNKKLSWYLNTKYFISGHKKSNFDISGHINKIFFTHDSIPKLNSFISLSANFSRKAPDFFEEHYYSNHYKWDSTFIAKDLTQIKLFYSKPKWSLSIGIAAHIFDNFIYYNDRGLPTQTTSTYNVYSAYLIKNFKIGFFHTNNQFVYQDNGNKYALRIPSIIFFNSSYVNFNLFKKVLNVNIGFDFYYYDKYYGYAYKPATGVFYVQNSDEVGNYPLLDAFLRVKLRRAKLFLKVTHVNYMLTGTTPLYTLSKYPINGRTLKMGVSWNFYD